MPPEPRTTAAAPASTGSSSRSAPSLAASPGSAWQVRFPQPAPGKARAPYLHQDSAYLSDLAVRVSPPLAAVAAHAPMSSRSRSAPNSAAAPGSAWQASSPQHAHHNPGHHCTYQPSTNARQQLGQCNTAVQGLPGCRLYIKQQLTVGGNVQHTHCCMRRPTRNTVVHVPLGSKLTMAWQDCATWSVETPDSAPVHTRARSAWITASVLPRETARPVTAVGAERSTRCSTAPLTTARCKCTTAVPLRDNLANDE